MASNPSVLGSLMPGANIGGSSVAVPPVPGSAYGTQAIGGNTNPFLPVPATGQSAVPLTSPSTAAPTGTSGATATLGGSNLYDLLGGGPNSGVPGNTGQSFAGLDKALRNAGYPGGIAALLTGFLQSGAGFNPAVAQALINAMGPSIERGTENIAEQFSVEGNRFGSPAATGIADFQSQVNLNIGEIYSQLYEQSVSNYLSVLTGALQRKPSALTSILGGLSSLSGDASSLLMATQ